MSILHSFLETTSLSLMHYVMACLPSLRHLLHSPALSPPPYLSNRASRPLQSFPSIRVSSPRCLPSNRDSLRRSPLNRRGLRSPPPPTTTACCPAFSGTSRTQILGRLGLVEGAEGVGSHVESFHEDGALKILKLKQKRHNLFKIWQCKSGSIIVRGWMI